VSTKTGQPQIFIAGHFKTIFFVIGIVSIISILIAIMMPKSRKKTLYLSSIACFALGIIQFFLCAFIFTAREPITVMDRLGRFLFWCFPICPLLILLGIVFLVWAVIAEGNVKYSIDSDATTEPNP
jgi:hypothetical protein